ncbi:MAG TPA: tRNA (adenosine(37)-N6)-threonylcarbamoyltransferase complex ATPase subunit type 1 TsaE [Thermoanaerobaculia bacterium]|nr:tRNA (adenosine(37)-N6)-threonylcarbamoyltransferase complex ATPase subunit type 1 TsaE [Thermoanaerobaculia bacterium]
MRVWRTATEEETRAVGREFARELAPDGVLLLSGDLGSGKTVLAQGIGEGLGIAARDIQSPTYTLIREHRGSGGDLVHADLYRLEPADVEGLGLEERLAGPGVKVIEWAERLPFPVPGARSLALQAGEGGGREIVETTETDPDRSNRSK